MANPAYRAYLKSDHWRELRARKLAEQPRCLCGKSSRLEVHHMRYRKEGWHFTELSDLKALCHKCHEITHGFDSRPKMGGRYNIPVKVLKQIRTQRRERKKLGRKAATAIRTARNILELSNPFGSAGELSRC